MATWLASNSSAIIANAVFFTAVAVVANSNAAAAQHVPLFQDSQ